MLMFPDEEKKLAEVVAACPKQRVFYENAYTTQQAIKMARQKGLPLCLADIQNRLKRIEAGREPRPEGLKRDEKDPRHRWILPQSFVDSLLAAAEARKNLPGMLQRGTIIPLSQLATDLGLKEMTLHRRAYFGTVRIGGGRFATAAEAKKLKKFFEKLRSGEIIPIAKLAEELGLSSRALNPSKILKKTRFYGRWYVKKEDAGKFRAEYFKKRSGEAPHSGIKIKTDHRTTSDINWWMKNMIPDVKNKIKRRQIITLLKSGRNLPHDQFKRAIMVKVNAILAEKGADATAAPPKQ